MDVLRALQNILDRTPADAYACPPLSRQTISAAVAEIRRLRQQLAAVRTELAELAAAPDQPPQAGEG